WSSDPSCRPGDGVQQPGWCVASMSCLCHAAPTRKFNGAVRHVVALGRRVTAPARGSADLFPNRGPTGMVRHGTPCDPSLYRTGPAIAESSGPRRLPRPDSDSHRDETPGTRHSPRLASDSGQPPRLITSEPRVAPDHVGVARIAQVGDPPLLHLLGDAAL